MRIAFLLTYFLTLGCIFLIWLAQYILQGMGLYKIAQAQGEHSPWMAFVPWLRTYLHGKIAGEIPLGRKSIKNAGIWMVLGPVIFGAVFAMVYVIIIVSVMISTIGGGNIFLESIGFTIFFFFVFGVFMIGIIVYAAVMGVLRGMVNYQIFKRFNSESRAVLHMLLSIFVPMYQAIYFFMLRKHVCVIQHTQQSYQKPQQEPVQKESTVDNTEKSE